MPDCGAAKHPCPDCTFCQWCGDDRCRLCLNRQKPRKKLSLAEQVALYERLNRGEGSKGGSEK